MKKYRIYNIRAIWNQPGYQNNSTSITVGLKDDEPLFDMIEWWNNYKSSDKNKDKQPFELIKLENVFLGRYSWWLDWFCHKTFNKFSSFEEAKDDFERFLTEEIHADFGYYSNEELHYGAERHNEKLKYEDGSRICLMGAEQIWRWRECECEACKNGKSLWTVIAH